MSSELVQTAFDYGLLDEGTRVRLQVRAESIRSRLKRTAEDIVAIGQDLLESKNDLGHGQFLPWLKAEFDMGQVTANNFIQVAKRFGEPNKLSKFDNLGVSILYLLAAPSTPDTVVSQVQSGDIPPTLEAIKAAKEAEKQRADEAETKNKQLQTKFDFYKQDVEQQKELLNAKIDDLEKDISEAQTTQTPEDTPETKAELERLKTELQERTKERDNLAQIRAKLSNELDEQKDANKARREQEMYEHRINDRVKKSAEEWGKCSVTFLGQLSSPIESQVVTANNWALLDHAADMAQKIIDAIKQANASKDTAFLNSEVESNAL